MTVPPTQTLRWLPEGICVCAHEKCTVMCRVKRHFAWMDSITMIMYYYVIRNTNMAVRKQSCLNRCWLFLCQFIVKVYHFWSCWTLTALVWAPWRIFIDTNREPAIQWQTITMEGICLSATNNSILFYEDYFCLDEISLCGALEEVEDLPVIVKKWSCLG